MQINLSKNKGFKWFCKQSLYVKGYLFDRDNHFYKDEELLNYFADIKTVAIFEEKIREANGFFAVVLLYKDNQLLAAVDRLRSLPIFYGNQESDFFISDDGYWVADQIKDRNLDPLSESEFLLTGYVVGDNTLFNSVKQLQAGQYLIRTNEKTEVKFYYTHLHRHYIEQKEAAYFSDLNAVYQKVFQRLTDSTFERTIVIPLSGGYDSRSIAAMLKKIGYKNVICYTYGRKTSFEVKISEQVAKSLGYQWYFIEYTREKWLNSYYQCREYAIFASNLASLPHIQDFLAVQELKEKSIIPPDSIFVPGFCGDLLGGSYVPLEIVENKSDFLLKIGLVEYIYKKHFCLENYINENHINLIKNHINDTLQSFPCPHNLDDFVSINEAFFTNHKVAKFVVNALRVYEFFGYEWRMPLWDNTLIEYWYRIPLHQRIKDKLYDRFLLKNVFKQFDIDFKKGGTFFEKSIHKNLKNLLKNLIPPNILNNFVDTYKALFLNSIDINNFYDFIMIYESELKARGYKNIKSASVNQVYSLWFILTLKENDNLFNLTK